MSLGHKYSTEIDWDFGSVSNKYTIKKNNKKNTSILLNNSDRIDYSEYKVNKSYQNNKIIKKTKHMNKKSYAGIYYGLFFLFLFGFLFFLSVSVGFAASNNYEHQDLNVLYSDNKSEKILEDYIFDKKENTQIIDKKISIINKIEYSKYRVQKNDSYGKIAGKFGLNIDTILLVNGISKNKLLKAGTELIIPNQDGRIIKVKNNDSIFKIANRYGIKWEQIVDVNSLESSVIIPGSKLFIPGSKMTSYEKNNFFGKIYIWPVRGKITSYYGSRIDPFTGAYAFHTGIDIKNKYGTSIKCVKDGKVVFTGWNKIYGNFIMVKHDKNIITLYGHLSKISVKKNQYVKQSDIIGKMGSTGRSTGPHLHFEVRKNGKLINPFTILD